MLGAGDQIDSSGVNAKVKDPGKVEALSSKGAKPCLAALIAGSRLSFRAEHPADLHPFGFWG